MRLTLPRYFVHVAVNIIPCIFSVLAFLYIFTWYWESAKFEGVERLNGFKNNAEEKWRESRPPAAIAPLDAVWQPVSGTRFRFYVYSAYVERRTVAAVRIIAASKTSRADPVFCRLWLSGNRTVELKTSVKPIHENDGLKYSATYVLCLLDDYGNNIVDPNETVGATIAVIASSAVNRPPTNLLRVLETKPKSGIEEQLHVCVKPFQRSYNRNEWLVEWFELNRLLGASHFYMYKESLSSSASCLLDHYSKQGIVTLLSWNLPIVSLNAISKQGLLAAFNDCLYRSMSSAGWLVVIDPDEIVIPRRERSLQELLTALKSPYKSLSKAPAAFLFRNVFFYLNWEDDSKGMASLVTSRKTRRSKTPLGLRNRSKYIVRPSDTIEIGKHFVWEFKPGTLGTTDGVPIDKALLHHYRVDCEFDNMDCLAGPATIDRTAQRWTDDLYKRVKSEKQRLLVECTNYNHTSYDHYL